MSKIICSYRGTPQKSTVGLPIGVRLFPPDENYPYNRVEIETKRQLTAEQEKKLFKILGDWFLQLKKEV
ncbi:hypothetical protein [Pseudanabaena phage PA-SR01]|nr:hypothetical protein [Pseudanabaena phage PA-SR01]